MRVLVYPDISMGALLGYYLLHGYTAKSCVSGIIWMCNEGEKANESGAVLNPALMSISTKG